MQKLKLRDRHFCMRIETNSTYMILLEGAVKSYAQIRLQSLAE